LATPCSAPFLGTAVSFAFSRGPLEVVAIFAALGLGLSLPYLAVAQFPGLATRLPRPGPWTIHMKRILGLALIGTAVWLLSVLGTQIGTTGAAIVAGTMTAAVLTLALAALGRLPRVAAAGVVAGLALIAFVAPSTVAPLSAAQKSGGDSDVGRWQAFDRSQLSGLVADGRVVLVDVTADWCVTCQVNKRLVLNNGTVVQRLASLSALSLRADWTLPNRDIADYLASHGRYGIPFNVAYGPSAPRGIVLPELLTVDAMLSALDRAAAKP
jgi:suppressor for copper-sensitivity B